MDVPPSCGRFADLPRQLQAVAFPRWKRPIVRQCFPGRDIVFVRDARAVPSRAAVLLWGMAAAPAALATGSFVVRLEDGFLRSAGLGADIVRPMSWVADRRGMHYDASAPSDLESILATHAFDEKLRARAARAAS